MKTKTLCPTCGAECKVEGNVTHYYVPVTDDLRQELKQAQKELKNCTKGNKQLYILVDKMSKNYALLEKKLKVNKL